MKKVILVICIIINLSYSLFATTQQTFYKKYEKLEVVITTLRNDNESINLVDQIGNVCNNFLVNANSNVFVKLEFIYQPKCSGISKYYLNYQNKKRGRKNRLITIDSLGGLELTIVSTKFNIYEILKLLNYSIKNVENIKNKQKIIDNGYSKFVCFNLDIIDSVKNSSTPQNILQEVENRVFHLRDSFQVQYYFQNNKYHFFNKKDSFKTAILSVDNIYKICDIDVDKAFIFDTDSSFYYLDLNEIRLIESISLPRSNECRSVLWFVNKCESDIILSKVKYLKETTSYYFNINTHKVSVLNKVPELCYSQIFKDINSNKIVKGCMLKML